MTKIRGVVERITFQNPENGYSVLRVAVKGYNELVTVVGNLVDANVGSVLLIEGDWKVDKKYGSQFIAQKWEETVPATVFGIEKYLGSGLIKGVGSKFAKRIVNLFGMDTISVIEDNPERLNEVDGIGKKRVEMIVKSWEQQKEIKNIMLFLQGYDVSTSFAAKIYRMYGNDSIKIVKSNPYRLADDIWGIGFKTADSIASKLGFEKNCFTRCRSGILYTLNQLADEGHVYSEKEQLIAKSMELLDTEREAVTDALEKILNTSDLILDEEAIYLPPFYMAETCVARRLKLLNDSPAHINTNLKVNIPKLQEKIGIEYDEIQAQGIQQAVNAKVMVLTGGPGTGKTTTTLGIIRVLQIMGLRILLAAPTGRAAKRMTETTGMEAKTIHRLLEFKPPEGYQKNENSPLDGDVLIVDESSMIDIILMNSLLKAIPPHMKLIFVGDIDQLPSVGAGNVLRDIIDSEQFPVIRLTKIFRQAQSS
ncbi:MAG: AAA family ATPase, partial [Ruminococcus sp.]|nr:AAA family ATPase [Ruminococcus sp.]